MQPRTIKRKSLAVQPAEKEIITETTMAATCQAATTTALEEKTMHNEKKTNGKISKTLSNKTSI